MSSAPTAQTLPCSMSRWLTPTDFAVRRTKGELICCHRCGSFLGGYNSGIRFSTLKNYLNTEAGINRVFVRATRTPGEFTLTATRPGLKPATATITSAPFQVSGGLTTVWPRRYGYVLGAEPAAMADNMPTRAVAVKPAAAPATGVMREFAYTGTQGDTLNPPMPVAHIEHNGRNGSRIYVDEPWTFAGCRTIWPAVITFRRFSGTPPNHRPPTPSSFTPTSVVTYIS